MLPGLSSFAPIAANQVVAHDARGPVLAPQAGLLLMPRYQAQGDDGYFLVREVRPIWLQVSEWLRRAGVPHLVPYLPGVRRDPARPELLVVDPRVARTRVAEVMHLCGFRRRASSDQRYVFSRRGPRR
jgi:succinylglutamate desuccinylase